MSAYRPVDTPLVPEDADAVADKPPASARAVGYLGSFDDQGVAVIKTTDPAHPVLTDVLSTHINSNTQSSDSADLDLVGRYLAVSHQPWTHGGFAGVSIY